MTAYHKLAQPHKVYLAYGIFDMKKHNCSIPHDANPALTM